MNQRGKWLIGFPTYSCFPRKIAVGLFSTGASIAPSISFASFLSKQCKVHTLAVDKFLYLLWTCHHIQIVFHAKYPKHFILSFRVFSARSHPLCTELKILTLLRLYAFLNSLQIKYIKIFKKSQILISTIS